MVVNGVRNDDINTITQMVETYGRSNYYIVS